MVAQREPLEVAFENVCCEVRGALYGRGEGAGEGCAQGSMRDAGRIYAEW